MWTQIRTEGYAARTSISLLVAAIAGVLIFLAIPLWGFMDLQPTSFSYLERSPPDPGRRYFLRKGDIWTEKDKQGRSAHFKIMDPRMILAPDEKNPHFVLNGTWIQRIDKEHESDSLFIPDYYTGDRSLWAQKTGGHWHRYAHMDEFCGYFHSYEKLECEG